MCSLKDLLASYSLVVVTAEATYSTLVTPINKRHTTMNEDEPGHDYVRFILSMCSFLDLLAIAIV